MFTGCRQYTREVEGRFFFFLFSGVRALILANLRLPLEDKEWASTKRRGSQPVGNKCLRCWRAITAAWPLKGWDAVMLEIGSNPEMKAEALSVLDRFEALKGPPPPPFRCEDFSTHVLNGVTVTRHFRFYKKDDFKKKFGAEPSALHLPLEKLVDDMNQEHLGVFVLADEEGIDVKTFQTRLTDLSELLQPWSQQLRQGQGAEYANIYTNDQHKVLQKGLCSKTAVKASEIGEKVALHLAEVQRKEAQAAAVASLVPAETAKEAQQTEAAAAAGAAAHGDDSDSSDDVVGVDGGPSGSTAGMHLLPSQQAKKAPKGKASAKKPKASGMGSGAAKGAGVSEALVTRVGKKQDNRGPSPARSAASGVSTASKKKKRQTPQEKAKEWLVTIDPKMVLENSKVYGREIWQAHETMLALERCPEPGHEVVELKAHLRLARLCQVLLVSSFLVNDPSRKHGVDV